MLMSDSVSVAANAKSANVLAGLQFEFLPSGARVQLRASSAATGIRADFNIGGEQLAVDTLVPPTNRFPISPDDTMVTTSGRRGERLFLTFRNTTAGALVVQWAVEVMP
jgi:hypothetical protein